jgi:Tol biopolymer transport system component
MYLKAGSWNESGAFAEAPVFSPDGRWIAYVWVTEESPGRTQLRVVRSTPGGRASVVLDGREGQWIQPSAWSPDGQRLLVTIDNREIAWVTLAGGAIQHVNSVGGRFYQTGSRPRLSPDGNYIVYAALPENLKTNPPPADYSKDQHIYVLSADGTKETELVPTAGVNREPVWTEDGSHVVFLSDRSGMLDLWSIAVQEGQPAGFPALVASNVGDASAFRVIAGSFFFLEDRSVEYVSVVETGAGGRGQPGRVIEQFVGIRPTFSPDGNWLAFKRRLPTNARPAAGGYVLTVHSLESGQERAYPSKLGTAGSGSATWFHDGKSLLIGQGRPDGTFGTYRVDVASGAYSLLRCSGQDLI